jgi:hypothetical protein
MESATLFLTINVSANASSSLPAPANTPSPTIVQPTTVTQTEIPQTEISRTALRRAEEAVNAMETWSIAVDVIKRVMDAVSPVAAVCPTSFCLSLAELTPSL